MLPNATMETPGISSSRTTLSNASSASNAPAAAQDEKRQSAIETAEAGCTSRGSDDSPADNMFAQGRGTSFRTLTRWDTVFVLVTNQMGLGVLSLPSILQTLGLVPGIVALVGLGLVTVYTSYELLQFHRVHPTCVNMVDMIGVVGGLPLEIIAGFGLLLKLCMTAASATVTLSIAFNTLSSHAVCTVVFAAIGAICCWILCVPRTFKFVSHAAIPATVSILAAVFIVIISLGISGPDNAPPGFHKSIRVVGNPSFRDGMNACLKVCYAYAGNVSFVSYMAEMKNPSKDFMPAIVIHQIFAVVVYFVTGISIYCLAGQYTTSPALGSAPILPAKIAYGIVLPALLSTGLVFGHTAAKFLYVVAMRAMKATHQVTDRSLKSWSVWIISVTSIWVVSFVLAGAIPIFDYILSMTAATSMAWFTFGISGVFWYHRNWEAKFQRRNIGLAIVNAFVILQAIFMNGVGLWASISGLMEEFEKKGSNVRGPFSCADNSMFSTRSS